MRPGEAVRLGERLGRGTAAERESAIARLRVLGARGLEPALSALSREPAARLDALAVLAGVEEAQAQAAIVRHVGDPAPEVARRAIESAAERPSPIAAAALARRLDEGPESLRGAALDALARLLRDGCVEALEPLVRLSVNEREDEGLRTAAIGALSTVLAPTEAAALLPRRWNESTAAHQSERLRAPGGRRTHSDLDDLHSRLASAQPGPTLRRLVAEVARAGAPASIPTLHAALVRLGQPGDTRTPEAADARGHIHLALAALRSRIALYDLRESLEARPPPALTLLLEAAAAVGDASLVPALAGLATDFPEARAVVVKALSAIRQREDVRRDRIRARVRPAHRRAFDEAWERAKRKGPTQT